MTLLSISSKNFDDFCAVSKLVLSHLSNWLDANLVPNLDSTYAIKFEMHDLAYSAYILLINRTI